MRPLAARETVVEEFRSVFADGRPSRGRLHVALRGSLTVQQLQQEPGDQ